VLGAPAPGQGIVVTKIAETSATGGLGLSVPSINNLGTVAFVDTTAGHTGLFTGTGGPLTTIDTTSNYSMYSPGNGGGLSVSINDGNRVAAMVGVPQTPESIFSTTGGTLTHIADGNSTPVSGVGTVVLSRPSIANTNVVAFTAYHSGGFAGNGVFTGSGGPLTTVVINPNSTSQLGVEPFSSRNNDYLTYIAPPSGVSSTTASVLHDGSTSTIGLPPPLASAFAHIAINDVGMLAGTTIHGLSGGLMVGNGTTTLLVIRSSLNDPSSPFATFDGISINHANVVVFYASGGTFSGLYTGPSRGSKVIETGDPLDGSTVTSLAMGSEALNDLGQVTFWAKLSDGRQGIYVTSVPEPATVLLVLSTVVSAATWGFLRRRRREDAAHDATAYMR